jgi:uncharacterized protein YdaU (DUF1376 family)
MVATMTPVKDKLIAEWFWTDRWIGSSAFLLPLEVRGLYREMLTQSWRRGAHLPAKPDTIKRSVAATDEEWARAWPAVAPYWHLNEAGLLVNDTQIAVYQEARDRAFRATDRAHKAARIRWAGNGRG